MATEEHVALSASGVVDLYVVLEDRTGDFWCEDEGYTTAWYDGAFLFVTAEEATEAAHNLTTITGNVHFTRRIEVTYDMFNKRK